MTENRLRSILDGMSKEDIEGGLACIMEIGKTAQSHLKSLSSTPTEYKCYLLRTIPLEVRNLIYEYLLISDVLFTSDSVTRPFALHSFEGTHKYGLYPEVMYTCRQVYEEGSAVLYGVKNTFLIDCCEESKAISPLFRASSLEGTGNYTRVHATKLHLKSALMKVKSWKVILGTAREMTEIPATTSFVFFCRGICDVRPKFLRIEIVPKGIEFSYNYLKDSSLEDLYHPVKEVLTPLKMLRGIPNLEFGVVSGNDLPLFDGVKMPKASHIEHIHLGPLLEAKIKSLVQGDSKVIHLWKMYDKLVAYAQTFERNSDFKAAMKSEYGEARKRLDPPRKAPLDSSRDYPWFRRGLFKSGPVFHPVEDMLEHASFASEISDKKKFKAARQAVLEYLEPQYRRILAASEAISSFIKALKHAEGLLDANFVEGQTLHAEDKELATALVLLEDYAASFQRELSTDIRIQIALRSHEWELAYCTLSWEDKLTKLRKLLERGNSSDDVEFVQLFADCVYEMDEQYLDIRKARKAVFQDDPASTTTIMGMSLDEWAQPWRCDEKINWAVNEPDLGPWEDPNAESDYNSDLESMVDSIVYSEEEVSSDSDIEDESGDD
ncbi:hypothetical protein N431DRAFT_337959 [Stipitochalara longipes BDJ]|nr:hypothetical protein N431DRAFT_337959 [Stipitochalara longipes BDJ]